MSRASKFRNILTFTPQEIGRLKTRVETHKEGLKNIAKIFNISIYSLEDYAKTKKWKRKK